MAAVFLPGAFVLPFTVNNQYDVKKGGCHADIRQNRQLSWFRHSAGRFSDQGASSSRNDRSWSYEARQKKELLETCLPPSHGEPTGRKLMKYTA